MSVCHHCTTFGLEIMRIFSQCSWQQLKKTGSGALAEHLSVQTCTSFLIQLPVHLPRVFLIWAMGYWLKYLPFTLGWISECFQAVVCWLLMEPKCVQNAAQLGKRSVLPSHRWSLLLQELSWGKNAWLCGFCLLWPEPSLVKPGFGHFPTGRG